MGFMWDTLRNIVTVPLARYATDEWPSSGWWNPDTWRGPGGLYGIRETDDEHTFQVYRLFPEEEKQEKVSEPFYTPEGARKFAERLAAGGDPKTRFA